MTEKQRQLADGLVAASLLIGFALAAVAGRRLGVADPELPPRIMGVLTGLVIAGYGNVIPRRLVRYDPDSARPARRQAALRFAGWTFVVAGLANALVWAFAPSANVALWSMLPIIAAVALVLLRCLRSKAEGKEA
ncbi:MAG: hypothetical protein JO276_08975 [Sphingomonadaceae bacterium]|nr:hypothetical protein [Sphingomonadaceae bacterium]